MAVGGTVTATFSKAVVGVSEDTFLMKNSATGAFVPGSVSRNGTTNQWVFTPTVKLPADTRLTGILVGGQGEIRDSANTPFTTTTWVFTTGAAPTLLTRSPYNFGTNAAVGGNVTVTFTEAVTGVSAGTFTLKNTTTGAAVSAKVTRNGTTNQWVLDPSADLAKNTRYTATLTGGTAAIRDRAGNPFTTNSWVFTTAS